MGLDEILSKKKLSQRQKSFIEKIVAKGGNFTNIDLGKNWGAKSLPSSFKKTLLNNPPLLRLIQSKPCQLYELAVKTSKISKPVAKQKSILNNSLSDISDISSSFPVSSEYSSNKLTSLEERIEFLEIKFKKLISPYKKIKIKDFLSQLNNEYDHLNPLNDISGVDFDILKRRTCRKLEISNDYFEDLIYDLQKSKGNIVIQMGRGKKYVQIKKK